MKKVVKIVATALYFAVSLLACALIVIILSCIATIGLLLSMMKRLLADCIDKCINPYVKEKLEDASK